MWIASPLPLPACTNEIRMLRTITLLTSLMFSPQPVRPEPEPTPRMVLFAATRTSSEQVKLPLTRIVCVVLERTAVFRSASVLTVTVGPPAPPVVPPPWVAQPINPPGGGGGGWLVEPLGDGVGVVTLGDGVDPTVSTVTSSKLPDANSVNSPIRPVANALLLPEPTWVSLTEPVIELPLT